MARGLVERVVDFCRTLRAAGMPVTLEGSVLAARALDLVDVLDRDDLRLALRSVLVSRREDQPRFDLLFDELWSAGTPAAGGESGKARTRVTRNPSPGVRGVTLETWMRGPDGGGETPVPVRAPSAHESLGTVDFAGFDNDQVVEFRRLARRIARRLALRKSRRWRPSARGERFDPRRTARASLRTGGDAVQLARRTRKPRRTKLVVVCDVSGSMEVYARFLLQFLHALQNSFARVETFVFSTRLTRVTGLLKGSDWAGALGGVAREVRDWSGGTRIGESLADFVERWIDLVDDRTAVLVLSDGWETGDPEVLRGAMAAIHGRAAQVIWLNPLMSSADFTPASRGMQAVLPHIDLLWPAHNLAALERLARELVVRRARRARLAPARPPHGDAVT
jgi:hypothetical protein